MLDRLCLGCHSPDGVAAEQNAALKLLPAEYPGFLDANIENLTEVAKLDFDGEPLLLRKPLGQVGHGGGAVLSADSEEYAALADFVERLGQDDFCTQEAIADFSDVELLDAQGTYRKATLQLAGRLPTPDEQAKLAEDSTNALTPLLDALLNEEAFYERLKDIYNDQFLTDLYIIRDNAAINLLSTADYPNRAGEAYDALDAETKARANRAIAREPLELIVHVVRNDMPFSEILTADYTVVNPFSAQVYDVDVDFKDPSDEHEFVPARVVVPRPEGPVALPHAGVLTTPALLNRMPTTATNRNRHRARRVLELFLATDILRIGARPIDAEDSSRYNNPTRDDPQCTGCHRQIDPIAGAFLKWDDRDQERYYPDREWYPEMFPPGFGSEVMSTDEYGNAQTWLGERIGSDPRFVLATVHALYTGITGRKPLLYPPDANAEDFAAQRAAWDAQDAMFRRVGERFVEDNMNLKTLVRELIATPYFRARNAQAAISGSRETELRAIGTGRFSIPKTLAHKIRAVTGIGWARNATSKDYLLDAYRILYGGMDSDSVTERLTSPNGIMANLAWRMANEVACAATATDFARPAESRLLFPGIELTDLPAELPAEGVDPASSARIREALRHLHEHVLGESLTTDSPEIARTYQLLVETWLEGAGKLEDGTARPGLASACQARIDPETGDDLPDARQITRDDTYALRSWMAVLTYLLSDYRFLYE